MARDASRPIIIRKVVEEVHGGHHGGAWKVAYADFVTAMMAFFLLLWLISSASEDTLKGLSEYFSDAKVNESDQAHTPRVLTRTSILNGHSIFQVPAPPFADAGVPLVIEGQPLYGSRIDQEAADDWARLPVYPVSDKTFSEMLERYEREQFEDAKNAILERLQGADRLAQLRENLVIEQTPEGLRIEILDRDKTAMFPLGSDRMFEHTKELLKIVMQTIADLPQKISIEGHTDAHPFAAHADYDNWRLSTDRAHATRVEMLKIGLDPGRIAEITGRGDADLLLPETPHDPRNRRISIMLLRDHGNTQNDGEQSLARDRVTATALRAPEKGSRTLE